MSVDIDQTHTDIGPGRPRAKATLFCPECGHESNVDGDWRERRTHQSLRYRCPECHTTIATRPVSESPAGYWQPYDVWQEAWETSVESAQHWQQFWIETLSPQ